MSKNERKVGLLYDSINNNTGDKAIGIVMEEFCKEKGIEYEIVDPFSFAVDDYSILIIGGGHLLRDPGDSFYDNFRVDGNHILNAMGVTTSEKLDYLKEYAYVSVRSSQDCAQIQNPDIDVNVIPCVSMSMTGKEIDLPKFSENSIGVHLVAYSLQVCQGIEKVINSLPYNKVFIPFTHYNRDKSLMESIRWNGDFTVLNELEPKQLFSIIGKMKFVIVSSLHATIFAYVQNVPFLSFYQEKTYNFLLDRGLQDLIFRTTEELVEKLKFIEEETLDFSNKVAADKRALKNHFDTIENIIKEKKESTNEWEIVKRNSSTDVKVRNLTQIIQIQDDVIHQRDNLVREIYAALDNLRQEIASKDAEIISQNNEIIKKSEAIVKANQELDTANQAIDTANQELKSKEKELSTKEQEIQWMQASRFWKLRNFYVKAMKTLGLR